MKKFNSFTAEELLSLLQKQSIKTILDQLAFYKKAHKQETTYQVWSILEYLSKTMKLFDSAMVW